MKCFYLSGQHTFSNRGCEAIVRSTVALLRNQFSSVEVFVPSNNIARDKALWQEAGSYGVRFVRAYQPWFARYWIYAQRLPVAFLKRAGWPFPVPKSIRNVLARADAVLSVGGDNYSLDYYLPSLYVGLDSAAMDMDKPVVLWGASVGPFEREPHFLPVIKEHLRRMMLITARESVTLEYLKRLGLSNVVQVADPAFALEPEQVELDSFWPEDKGGGVLGFNFSALVLRDRARGEPPHRVFDEIAAFLRNAVANLGVGVILVPHVIQPGGVGADNDVAFMERVLTRTGDMSGRIKLMDSTLNAAQIKYVVSKCRFFIGARTHSTITALSSCVPTISIAYSTKAKGINYDLFGHTDYVLETTKVSAETLENALFRLLRDEDAIRSHLSKHLPLWRDRAAEGARQLAELLR